LQVCNIRDAYKKYGVNQALMDVVTPLARSNDLYVPSYSGFYNLDKRVTKSQLIDRFANKVKMAETQFLKQITSSYDVLKFNLQTCETMDDLLGNYIYHI
jgi:hypothetical protein